MQETKCGGLFKSSWGSFPTHWAGSHWGRWHVRWILNKKEDAAWVWGEGIFYKPWQTKSQRGRGWWKMRVTRAGDCHMGPWQLQERDWTLLRCSESPHRIVSRREVWQVSRLVTGRASGKWQPIGAQAHLDGLGGTARVGECVMNTDLIKCTGKLRVGNEERRKRRKTAPRLCLVFLGKE